LCRERERNERWEERERRKDAVGGVVGRHKGWLV
jgi:hypothetical protein